MAKVKLYITTFKVPIKRNSENEILHENTGVLSSNEVLKQEEIELDAPMVQIPTESKNVANYNKRQIKIAELDKGKDYIKKKLITKDKIEQKTEN